MANGSILYPLLVACLLVSSSFQSLHRHDGDTAMTPLTLDMDKSFHGCDQNLELKKASCRDKDLDTVPQNLSEDTEVLDLSDNNITKLLNSSFEVYPLTNFLDISFNDVRAIESAAFYPLKALMYLDLSFNPRLVLPATGVFMMSSQLSILDLVSTNLKSLPDDILKWSLHLDTAYLWINQLSFVNVSSCGMADTVLMTGNRLHHLTSRDFTFVCHTDTLDLRENPIQSVDPDVIASLHVRSLVLGGYPLSDEVLANIILGISQSDIEQLTIEEGSVGAFPKGFFDPLRDSSLSVLDFNSNDLSSLYPLVFSNLSKLIQFSFTYNNLPIDEIQPDFFEGMKALKVLIINYNQTIIVLSRAAVHDHWFILKFRTAMDHVSDTLTEFVFVVFLEDIPDDEMPFLARLYLSDGRPYIHWTENVRGQQYFWDELTKNLTINLRTNDLIPND
eukprot:XP_011675880.1 PREDICTED: leucine-rich repeat-containing G-protein coupled receptor 4-like [Strongylocentrotus purpuratus]